MHSFAFLLSHLTVLAPFQKTDERFGCVLVVYDKEKMKNQMFTMKIIIKTWHLGWFTIFCTGDFDINNTSQVRRQPPIRSLHGGDN